MTQSHPFDVLNGEQFLRLTTFRKDGRAVPTPVWFAREGDRLYVLTQSNSGKVKRLRHTTRVEICPCTANGTPKGPDFEAQAHLLPESEYDRAIRALNRKYGIQKRLFDLMQVFSRAPRTYIAIEMAE